MNNLLLTQKYFTIILIVGIFFISLPTITSAKILLFVQETSQDKRLTEEEINKLIEEAKQLTNKITKESLTAALEKYERLLLEYKYLGDIKKQATVYEKITQIRLNLGDTKQAIEDIKKLLEIYQALGDKQAEGKIHSSLGVVYGRLGEKEKQLEAYQKGLSIFQTIGDKNSEASLLFFLGLLLEDDGKIEKALDYYNQVLLLRETTDNKQGQLNVLSKISQVYLQIGKSQKALEFAQKALDIEKEIGNITNKSILLYQKGSIYFLLKDFTRARDCYQESLALARLTKNTEQEAAALNAIGKTYISDTGESLKYYLQAITLYKSIGKSFELPSPLIGVAITYSLLGDYKKAEEYLNQALALAQELNDKATEANILYFIGIAKLSTNNLNEATECFNKSLELYEKMGYSVGKVKNLYQLALLEQKKDLPKAIKLIEEALEAIEVFRTNINSQELGESYFDKTQNYYDLYIDLLIKLYEEEQKENYLAKALEINEKRRARSLRELLTEAQIDIRQGIDAQLLEKEKEIQVKLSIKEQQKRQLLAKKTPLEKIEKIEKELRELIYQRKETQTQIKINSPAYATLTQIQDISLPTIQSLLDDSTMLLEYSLGKDSSYIWLVTNNKVQYYKLASRSEIEKQAQIVYNLLVSKGLPSNVKNTSSLDSDYNLAVTKLSELVLFPLSSQLANKRLLIVADGTLQYIPFNILSKHTSLNRQRSFSPLILENEVVNLPSAATLLLLREKKEKLINKTTITIVADPIFSKDDPRIKQSIVKKESKIEDKVKNNVNLASAETFREKEINSINDLSRLPFSRQEATAITSLLSKENYQQFLDFDADYDLLTKGKLANNKILHFATHSIINNDYPELSGIVLSLVDREGNPKNGFLQLQEIYNLKFSANLVVLSACQTALGKEVKGEGLVGLTRGFMYAGAKQIIASLWKVDDRATAELMKYFYQNLLKNNQSPSNALREAQLQMMKQPRWKSPYYWAAFVLQGDFQ